jgi:hypothetical protein
LMSARWRAGRARAAGEGTPTWLSTPPPFNAEHRPDVAAMFSEQLRLQQRVMTALAPLVRQQAASEHDAQADARKRYAPASHTHRHVRRWTQTMGKALG